MEKKNIESGILELYVYGLSETENEEVTTMAKNNPESKCRIVIEKRLCLYPLVLLRFIRWKIMRKLKPNSTLQLVIERTTVRRWAAAILLLVGIGFNTISCSKQAIKKQPKMEQELNQLELKTRKAKLV
jgi:hypothetical protein